MVCFHFCVCFLSSNMSVVFIIARENGLYPYTGIVLSWLPSSWYKVREYQGNQYKAASDTIVGALPRPHPLHCGALAVSALSLIDIQSTRAVEPHYHGLGYLSRVIFVSLIPMKYNSTPLTLMFNI